MVSCVKLDVSFVVVLLLSSTGSPVERFTDLHHGQPDYGNCKDSTSPKPTSKTTQAAAPSSVVPSTTVAAPATSTMPCTRGTLAAGLSEGLLGLCSYRCDYNRCPQDICVRTRSNALAIPAPTGSGHGCPGTAQPGRADYAYYADLCEFTCSHGYCPPGAFKAC